MLYKKEHLPVILDLTVRGWGASASRRTQALRDEYPAYDVVGRLGEISVPTWSCVAATIRWSPSHTARSSMLGSRTPSWSCSRRADTFQ